MPLCTKLWRASKALTLNLGLCKYCFIKSIIGTNSSNGSQSTNWESTSSASSTVSSLKTAGFYKSWFMTKTRSGAMPALMPSFTRVWRSYKQAAFDSCLSTISSSNTCNTLIIKPVSINRDRITHVLLLELGVLGARQQLEELGEGIPPPLWEVFPHQHDEDQRVLARVVLLPHHCLRVLLQHLEINIMDGVFSLRSGKYLGIALIDYVDDSLKQPVAHRFILAAHKL